MAGFRTAFLARAVPLDLAVSGTIAEGVTITSSNRKAAILVGDFVKYTAASGSVPAYITKATEAEVAAHTATHIVAASDITLGGGYVKTDVKNYTVSDLLGATETSTVDADSETKKVSLYPILDWNDIVADTDQYDCAS